jgi:hypothetical protein
MAEAALAKWKLAAGFPLSIACLGVGNLLGVILTAVWGWSAIQKGEPGSVPLGFIQGYLGALIAIGASDYFLKTAAPAHFWVKWLVWIAAALLAIMIIWALAFGHIEVVFAWSMLAAVAAIVGMEVGRRVYDSA